MDHVWPGNIRELKSALEYAFVVAEEGKIDMEHLPTLAADKPRARPGRYQRDERAGEKEALVEALRQTRGNQTQAARLLGINRVTVWNRMRKYGIDLNKVISG